MHEVIYLLMLTRNMAAENVPKAQFGWNSPRRNFLVSLPCVTSFADIQQIDLCTGPQKEEIGLKRLHLAV